VVPPGISDNPIPAWYFWALRQIDRDAYTLIEVRLEGDKVAEDLTSKDTQVNMYYIPPDIWRDLKKEGTPFSPGERIYICDFFDYDNDRILFSRNPELTNLDFYTRLERWLALKRELPNLRKALALALYDVEDMAMDYATQIVKEIYLSKRSRELLNGLEDPDKIIKELEMIA